MALFDLDNTLADRTAAFQRWMGVFAEKFDVPNDAMAWIALTDGDGFVPRPTFFATVQERLQLPATVDELIDWYDTSYPSAYVFEEQSVRALESLTAEGWIVGIVTNGSTSQQMRKLQVTGLDRVAKAVCVSEDLGMRKPDRRIFEEAARRCAVPLDGWMVGDSPEADIVGGQGAGLRTAWLTRGRSWGVGPTPNISVNTVSEAVAHILSE